MYLGCFLLGQPCMKTQWEGEPKCLKWLSYLKYSGCCFMYNSVPTRSFSRSSSKLKSFQGRHNKDVISLIVGSLLSNSYLEKKEDNGLLKIRIIFIKYSNNIEYLMNLHTMFAKGGYCNFKRPKLYKLIGKGNKVFFLIMFKTYSFSSLIWLYHTFYRNDLKIVPEPNNLYNLLTSLTLATVFISSICAEEKALNTICGKFKGCLPVIDLKQLGNISHILKLKYNIETKINNNYGDSILGGTLLIKNSSKPVFIETVKAYILPSQYYLLNSPKLKLTFGKFYHKRGLVTLSPARFISKILSEF